MSVIVMGMEMPKRCEDCFCYRHNAEYDYAYCNISSVNVMGHGRARLNNCPLIPLPEKHGRLVDIDDLCSKGFFVARVECGGVQWRYSEDDFEPIVEAEGD